MIYTAPANADPHTHRKGASHHRSNAAVTVIVPTFERAQFVAQSLDSLLNQTLPPAQIIVVDDGSEDATAGVLTHYKDRVTVLSKQNGGKPSAINAALPLVKGDYIWVFDDDDIACPDALARHIEVHERCRGISFTYSACFRCHNDAASGDLVVDGSYPVRPFSDDEYFMELLLSSYVASPAVMVRTDVQRTVGEYRTDLFRSQDLEMALRWGLRGPAVRLNSPRPTYYRRDHPGSRGARESRFEPAMRTARARDFERRIMRDLADSIELRHYLPHSLWNELPNEETGTRARLRRWIVHLQKGMWDEAVLMLEDLTTRRLDHPLAIQDLRAYGLRALSSKPTIDELLQAPVALRAFNELLRRPQLQAIRAQLLRQLYYHARSEIRHRDFSGLARTVELCGRFLRPTINRSKRTPRGPHD